MQLLVKHPENRLGTKNGIEEIKAHVWFKNIDWEGLLNKKVYFMKFFIFKKKLYVSKDKTTFQAENN